MIIFIVTIFLLILSFLYFLKSGEFLFIVLLSVLLMAEIGLILWRPLDYKDFQVKYNATKTIISQVQEIKDYELIDRITEINQKIEAYNGLASDSATNIFFSKDIGNMELLPYNK